jgi:hypothetical protein
MVNWILGHNNDPRFRFKVLVSHDGVYNLESMYGATEELWFPEWEFKGTPWTNPVLYSRWSPHKFAQNFNTPILIIHSELDFRVPLGEGMQLFTAVQRKGIDSKPVSPAPITTSREIAIEAGRASFSMDKNDFGYLMPGYTLLLIPLYYRVQKFTENVSLRNFLPVMLMTGILFLLQNRGTLFFAVIVLVYAIFRIQSRYRYIFIIILGLLIIGAYLSTEKYWASFVDETSAQLSDPEYNRWKSLYYFIFQYSPHWLCYLMGNGYLSSHLDSGQFLMALMNSGFYQADLGIIGFWSMYGVIPILVIYAVVFKLLFYLPAPFYLKALSAHVLLVPICWGFSYYDMFLLILMSYLMGYYSEVFKPRPALKYSAVR